MSTLEIAHIYLCFQFGMLQFALLFSFFTFYFHLCISRYGGADLLYSLCIFWSYIADS